METKIIRVIRGKLVLPSFLSNSIMRLFFVAILFVMGVSAQTPPIEPGVSLELAKWRAARYSDVRYKLNLTLEKMSPVLKGTIEIRVNVKSSPPYEGGVDAALGGRGGFPIILDWRKIKGSESLSAISAVTLNGRVAENHPVGETPPPLLGKEGSSAIGRAGWQPAVRRVPAAQMNDLGI
jgi:hypothetical protein